MWLVLLINFLHVPVELCTTIAVEKCTTLQAANVVVFAVL
jgi:hypothetical protein